MEMMLERDVSTHETSSNDKLMRINNHQIYNLYTQFIERKRIQSENTANNYKGHIRDFFETVIDKEINFITVEDIQSLSDESFHKFIRIKISEISPSSISAKIDAVKSFLRFLKAKLKQENIFIDLDYFELIEKPKFNNESYDAMTIDEVYEMSELALGERNGELKRLLILFAFRTFLRKTAILKVKWEHFKELNGKIKLHAIDKGSKEIIISVSNGFFDELNKKLNKGQEYVFDIHSKTVDRFFTKLKNKMNFGNRSIVFHSIRKAGATHFYQMTNDIMATSRRLNHSDVRITERYIGITEYDDFDDSFKRENEKEDVSLLKRLTKEELIEIIDSSLDNTAKNMLLKDAQKIINS